MPQCAIDQPVAGALCYRQQIPFAGWLDLGVDQVHFGRIVAVAGDAVLGASSLLYRRPDVCRALGLADDYATGFRFRGVLDQPPPFPARLTVKVRAELAGGRGQVTLGEREIAIHPDDYTTKPYGDLVNPKLDAMLHRSHIYSTGYPAEQPSGECLALLEAYLPRDATVMDVGCGTGAYSAALTERGFHWTGVEIDRACLVRLAARGLRHRRIRRWRAVPWWYRLPAAEGEFEAAMAIEVLEHVHNVARFLSEIRRVVRRRACFSVPNLELLPMLADRAVAPWHVLEGDHRNFFSAPRLRRILAAHFRHVEVLTYGLHPLRSPEGLPLHYSLFAIADV